MNNLTVRKIRLLRITTVPISLQVLLKGQLSFFTTRNFEILAASSGGQEVVNGFIDGVPHKSVTMTRKITPLSDLISLFNLVRLIIDFKPAVVHTHTPKAGLLGMLSAWICRVPVRMHTVAGLPLMEKKGFTRKLLIFVERITYWCATDVYPNSYGLKQYIEENIGDFSLKVIGNGSSNGIDTNFFSPTEDLKKQATEIRSRYGISADAIVYSFVGRVVKDKGIGELVAAFKQCKSKDPQVFLLIIGPFEEDLDPIEPDDFKFLHDDNHVILAGYQKDVRPWIMASDIFVFPSYREGFPNVVMQAGALQVPCIVSNINGCNEIVEDKKTGLIVSPKNSDELLIAMETLMGDVEMRNQLALASRARIVRNYDQRFVWSQLENEYITNLNRSSNRTLYTIIIKPLFDRLVALIAVLFASPLMLGCMLSLAIANHGKVWFVQRRPGKNGKIFKVIKFRTMTDERNIAGELLPDEERLHGIGKFVRKTSLDELPQLLNVLKGDMSLVGPRPLLEEYLPLYSANQRRRHNVRPGITGWAQVNGRNAISWEEKFKLDVWYVENQSFLLDMKILFLTVLKVFKAEGISSATSATMEKFRGNNA